MVFLCTTYVFLPCHHVQQLFLYASSLSDIFLHMACSRRALSSVPSFPYLKRATSSSLVDGSSFHDNSNITGVPCASEPPSSDHTASCPCRRFLLLKHLTCGSTSGTPFAEPSSTRLLYVVPPAHSIVRRGRLPTSFITQCRRCTTSLLHHATFLSLPD